MTDTLHIDFGNLDHLIAAMNTVGDQAGDINSYFGEEVCNTSGFDYDECALRPIAAVLPKIGGYFSHATTTFLGKWSEVGDAVVSSARLVERQDGTIRHKLDSYRGRNAGPGCYVNDKPASYIENFHIVPIGGKLTDPAPGKSQLKHNGKFEAAADAWDTGRDTINDFIGLLNHVGAGIGKLNEKSLRDYIVYPLSGNYGQIGADANACKVVDGAMGTWGHNFGQLAAKSPAAITGTAGAGFAAQLLAYDTAMRAVGDAVGDGHVVFDEIAKMSERIAVEVENALTVLGEKITKLASKVASKFVPIIGWGELAIELAKHGLGVVQDIIDDIETVRHIIEDCFNLVDTVKAWAQTQADRLQRFHDVLDTMSGLPGVGRTPGLAGLSTHVGNAEKTLDDIDFGTPTSKQAGALTSKLGGLGAQAKGEDGGGGSGIKDGTIVDGPLPGHDPLEQPDGSTVA